MGMTRTEKSSTENNLKCGMLVKNIEDYEFFAGYLDNSRLEMYACNDVRMNTPDSNEGSGSFLTLFWSDLLNPLFWSEMSLEKKSGKNPGQKL